MRNAGGFSEIICDDPNATAVDKLSGAVIPRLADTFTCFHCARVVFVPPKQDPTEIGGFCYGCAKMVCKWCVDKGTCDPLEAKLARMEQRQDALRSYGMA